MLDKVMFSLYRAYFNAKVKLMSLANEEDGMQTVEAIILVVVAIVVAGAIINVLTGKDGQPGIISQLFTNIMDKITTMLNGG